MQKSQMKPYLTAKGWVFQKFTVRNPISHFLNVHKKNLSRSKKKLMNNDVNFLYTKQAQTISQSNQSKIYKTKKPQRIIRTASVGIRLKTNLKKNEEKNDSFIFKMKSDDSINSNKKLNICKGQRVISQYKYDFKSQENEQSRNRYLQKNQYEGRNNFKATNCGKYKRQMLFLQPNFRNSSSFHKKSDQQTIKSQILQAQKTKIYKQLKTQEILCSSRLTSTQVQSIRQYNPIQYLTEFQDNNKNKNIQQSQQIRQVHENKSQLKKKPNIYVLREKLKNHYHKVVNKSEYQLKFQEMRIKPEQFSIN